MKKLAALLLSAATLLTLCACNVAPEFEEEKTTVITDDTPPVSNEKSEEETTTDITNDTPPVSNDVDLQIYEAAIRGEICVYDERLGEVKLKDCRFPTNNIRLGECEILYKAILDLDGDGTNEYVLQSEDEDHIVLRHYNGKIYSYCFDGKSLFNLNTDGSFYWVDSYDLSNCTRGYSRIVFDGPSYRIKEIYRIKQTSPYDYGDGDHEYFVDGKQITYREFFDYYDSNRRREKMAIFSPLDISCEYPISAEKAYELASEFWGLTSGMDDRAAGKVYVLKIVILEKPNSDTQSYRIGCQWEGYVTHVIDSTYAQPPTSVSIHKELYVSALTGECGESPYTYTEAEIAMKMYEAFLKNEVTTGGAYLKNFREEYLLDYLWERKGSVHYAYVDMDGDGQVELLVGGIDTFVFSYSHKYNRITYISTYDFRAMNGVYVDGSYSWNYGSSDGVSYGLKKNGKDIWRIENDGGTNPLYYIGERSVTEEEMLKYLDENPNPARVEFTAISGEGWNQVIDKERAKEIASEYWNIKDGDIDGQTGETYRIFVSGIAGETYHVRLRSGGPYYAPNIDTLYINAVTGKILSDFLPGIPDGK